MQLLIIDVQNTYRSFCAPLISEIPEFSQGFSDIIYLYDNISGQEYYDEVPAEWMEEELEAFYSSLNVMTKQYSFFRGLMDVGVDEDDEELVKLGKFLIKHNLSDVRDIAEDEEISLNYEKEFKNSPLQNINFDDYSFSIPYDLVEDISSRIRNGVTLVGGARNACLKEVALLLRVLDISFTINEEYTY